MPKCNCALHDVPDLPMQQGPATVSWNLIIYQPK